MAPTEERPPKRYYWIQLAAQGQGETLPVSPPTRGWTSSAPCGTSSIHQAMMVVRISSAAAFIGPDRPPLAGRQGPVNVPSMRATRSLTACRSRRNSARSPRSDAVSADTFARNWSISRRMPAARVSSNGTSTTSRPRQRRRSPRSPIRQSKQAASTIEPYARESPGTCNVLFDLTHQRVVVSLHETRGP